MKKLWFFIIIITISLTAISYGQESQQKIEKLINSSFEKEIINEVMPGAGFKNFSYKIQAELLKKKREIHKLPQIFSFTLTEEMIKNTLIFKEFHPCYKEEYDVIKSFGKNKSTNSTNDWILNNQPTVVFPSANANGFINEAHASISNYTGSLNYNIPLFTLKSYELELPINLSYNTSGAKVDEIASWVGLGWTLNAGGGITRVMKGLPDEYKGNISTVYNFNLPAYGYLQLKNHPTHGFINIENFPTQFDPLFQKRFVRNAAWENLDGFDMGDGLGNGEAWDTQPDEFYFNFPGLSGKFVFDQNGNILTLPHSNLNITKTLKTFNIDGVYVDRIVQFDVITPEGYIYQFGDMDSEAVEYTINIQVSRKVRYYYPYWGYTINENGIYVDVWERLPRLIPTAYGDIEHIDLIGYNPFPYSSTWYLKKIASPTGDEINFNYEQNNYLDFYVTKRGHSVVIPNLSDGFITIEGTTYLIFYSYQGDNLPYWHKQEVTFFRNEVVHNTKILSSIVTLSGNKVEFITSSILREDNLGAKKLEYLKLFDHLNQEKKSFKFLYSYSQPENYQSKDLINLSTNEYDPLMGISFAEYDGNVNDQLLFSEQKRLFLDYLYEIPNEGEDILPPYHFIYNPGILPRRGAYSTDQYGYFNENNRGTNLRKIRYTGLFGDIVPTDEVSFDQFYIWNNEAYSGPSFEGEIANHCESCAKAGVLEKVITPLLGSIEFLYESNKYTQTGGTVSPISGLRVLSIKEFPNIINNSDFIATNYSYFGGAFLHSYNYKYSQPVNFENGKNITALSSSVFPDMFTHGCVIGYNNVKIQKSTGGLSVYNYINPTEIPNQSSPIYQVGESGNTLDTYPFPLDLSMDWKRGLEKSSTQTLNNSAETFSSINNYDLDPSIYTKQYAYGLIGGVYKLDSPDEPNVFSEYLGGRYKYESGLLYNESVTSKYYSSDAPGDETKAITKITNNVYEVKNHDNLQFTFLTENTTTTSNDKQLKSKFLFPLDINNPSEVYMSQAVVDKMKEKYILNVPIKQEIFVDEDQIDGSIISYNFQNTNEDLIRPSVIRKYEGVEFEINSIFDKYNNNGNLLQFHIENNIQNTYYWGYNKQYPIISAENITYDELESAIQLLQPQMESFLEDLGDLTEESQRIEWNSFNIALRESLPNAKITSYSYKSLINKSSETDPSGKSIYYEYDNFGRLKTVRNQDYKIINHIDYNYSKLINATPPIFNLTSNAGSAQVEIISDLNWSVSATSEWILILPPNSGSGNGSFSFSYSENSEQGTRSGKITISSTSPIYQITITVNQIANPYLTVEPTSIEVGFSQQSEIPINVISNIYWNVTTGESWITINPSSGQFNGLFNIQCEYNWGEPRDGTVIVDGSDVAPITINVFQDAHP